VDVGALLIELSGKSTSVIDDATQNEDRRKRTEELGGLVITAVFLAGFAGLYGIAAMRNSQRHPGGHLFMVATGLLLAYRFVKEARTSLATRCGVGGCRWTGDARRGSGVTARAQ